MPFWKHGTIWAVLTPLSIMLTGCTRGPVDPIPQYGDISGYVRTSSSKKTIEGATVTIAGQSYKVTRTGIYIFKEIPEGFHLLKAEKTGFQTYQTMIRVLDKTVHNVYMDKIIEYRDISGHVYLDGSDIPVPDVVVICGDIYDTTGADGSYLLENVLAATHALFALKDHFIAYEERISLETDTTVNVFLASAPLRGLIRHRLDGPVEGALVEIGGATAVSNGDGDYLVPTAPQGTHRLVISHPRYDSVAQIITVTAGENYLDAIVTRSIHDSLAIVQDASITLAELDGCPDCPEWGGVDDNDGDSELLKLEYFLRNEAGPPQVTYSARTRVLVQLPLLPSNALENMSGVKLVLFPAGDEQPEVYVSFRKLQMADDAWSENNVTWANGPSPSPLLFAAKQALPGQPLGIDVEALYNDSSATPTLLLQGEEVGGVDPPRRLKFFSTEAADEGKRPVLVVRYSF